MTRKPRDYRAEYRRRIARGKEKGYGKDIARGHPGKRKLGIKKAKALGLPPGTNVDDYVNADRKRVFGAHPRRVVGERSIPDYMLRLAELQKQDGVFDWTNEAAFIADMQALGLSEREAYGKLFGS